MPILNVTLTMATCTRPQVDSIKVVPSQLHSGQPKPAHGAPPDSVSKNQLFQMWRTKKGMQVILSMRQCLPQDDRKKQRRDVRSHCGHTMDGANKSREMRCAVMHACDYKFETIVEDTHERRTVTMRYHCEESKAPPPMIVDGAQGIFSISSRAPDDDSRKQKRVGTKRKAESKQETDPAASSMLPIKLKSDEPPTTPLDAITSHQLRTADGATDLVGVAMMHHQRYHPHEPQDGSSSSSLSMVKPTPLRHSLSSTPLGNYPNVIKPEAHGVDYHPYSGAPSPRGQPPDMPAVQIMQPSSAAQNAEELNDMSQLRLNEEATVKIESANIVMSYPPESLDINEHDSEVDQDMVDLWRSSSMQPSGLHAGLGNNSGRQVNFTSFLS